MLVFPDALEKRRKSLTLGFLSLAVALVWVAVFQAPDQHLHIWVLDVGQGDAILIRTPTNQKILIDGGPNESVLPRLGEVLPFWERALDLVVLSHPDADHVTGLVGVLKNYQVGQLLAGSYTCETAICREFEALVAEKGIPRWTARTGGKASLGDLEMRIYWPGGSCHLNRNDCSIVALLDFYDFEALFPGDIEERGQKALVLSGFDIPSTELLKVPHHGANCLWGPFLEEVSPEVAIVSVGRNSYGHPTAETLDKLREIGSKVFRTDEWGVVEIISDGRSWWVR